MTKTLLQKKNFNQVSLRHLVVRAVQEILSDPDFGLSLSERAKQRLRQASGGKTAKAIPFSEIKKKYF